MGVDWNTPLTTVLKNWSQKFIIQGNIDPHWLFLESHDLEKRVRAVFNAVKDLGPDFYSRWICGLGHGVLPKSPEENVKLVIRLQHEIFNFGPTT